MKRKPSKIKKNKKKAKKNILIDKAPSPEDTKQILAAAIEHHQNARFEEAEAGYRKIIGTNPNHADTNHLLGVIAYQTGNLEAAEQLISVALKTDPGQPHFHLNLGNVLQDQGRTEDAITSYEMALAINPDFPEAYNNIGNALSAVGNLEEASSNFQKALALRPDFVEGNNNLGNALKDLKQYDEAIIHLRKAITLKPDYAEAHHNLARALFENGKTEQAIESCKQAIALNPAMADSWINLGIIHQKLGHKEKSITAVQKALSIAPGNSAAHTALANIFLEFGQFNDALSNYRKAIDLDPDNEEAHSNHLMTLHYATSSSNQALFDAATNWAEPYNAALPYPDFPNTLDVNRKLRVGYVSADFSRHPVGFYLCRILPFHNSDSVEIVCYSNSHKSDDITETLRRSSALWRNVTDLSDEKMTEQIRDDGIDILVDLSGHTARHRLPVFAKRPAPVQVTWMGYTGTTGLTVMDYILADTFVLPKNEQDMFSETPKYLPGCYLCFDPPGFDIDCVAPPAKDNGFITFGSFNNRMKITAGAISAWARIMTDVADSRLLLKTPLLDSEAVRSALVEQFREHGIEKDRLLLEGRASRADLLRAYQHVDIALDTQPFSGGVTTAEAIWMGVPVISLSSPRWSGRLGETILNGIGLPELVAHNDQQYHDLAIGLAGNLPRLEQMHRDLRGLMEASPFCDGPAFADKLEQAYRDMWLSWCTTPTSSVDIKGDYAIAVDHHQKGRLGKAKAIYASILEVDGDHLASLHNLGVIMTAEGEADQAVALFEKALAIKPDYARAHDSLGTAFYQLGRLDDAVQSFRKALNHNPESPKTHYNLGKALKDNKQPDQALECYQEALRLNPNYLSAQNNLGALLVELNRQEEALDYFRQVLRINPDFSEGHFNLGKVFADLGQFNDALSNYRKAIDLDPDNEEAHSNHLMTLHYATSSSNQALFDAATNWAEPYNAALPYPDFPNTLDVNRKLRVGYVSADFSRHPVGFYLCRILPFHNSDSVEIVCYSNSHKSDDITETLRRSSALWRNVTDLSDEKMTEQIRDDGIDILVDLSGHTARHRLPVFAKRPAPVQVTWMGYTGTTGLTVMDYILADTFVLPKNEQDMFSETPKYLPGCYLCFDPPGFDIDCVAPPAKDNGFITFGSFNNRMKITAGAISAWARIMTDVADSRLLLKTPLLDSEAVRSALVEQFREHGIEKDRLLLEGRASRADLLRAYQHVDIALDTQPFSGGVTTAEAIWMGVPVISLSSPRWSGRLGETILNGIGLPELVAHNDQQYHDLAIGLAGNLPRLEQMHRDLRGLMEASPFCDGPAFADKLEQAYRDMWLSWCTTPTSSVDIKGDYAIAVDHHQKGRLGKAKAIYASILEVDGDHLASLHNLGVIMTAEGEADQAVALFEKALAIKPDYARAHDSLGTAFYQLGRLDDAVQSFRKALNHNPESPKTHYNLGKALKDNKQPDQALECYQEALRLNPNYLSAQNNLGALLVELNRQEEALDYFRQVLRINPDFSEGHFNLGNVYKDTGRYDEAIASYLRAIELAPDYLDSWKNLGIAAKLKNFTHAQSFDIEDFKAPLQATRSFANFEYARDAYRPHEADESYNRIITKMRDDRALDSKWDNLPGHTVSLLYFGRSGTGLMHSLIDSHLEISTLPSIYLSGYFLDGVWEELSAGNPNQLPERFVDKFEVLFDATSPKAVPGDEPEGLPMIGYKEGMTTVGKNRDIALKVDREAFCTEARRLMTSAPYMNAGLFFRIVHAAYEKAIGSKGEKHTLFYHIHNPSFATTFNFLSQLPDARIMMMIRDPLQCCESWTKEFYRENNFPKLSARIMTMLSSLDRVEFRRQESIGVRLEDLKNRPHMTMKAVCQWIGIKESPSLYEMTAQGEKWWGDPSSPDYNNKIEMSPFDDACLKRTAGIVFSNSDRQVIETLFHPFSALYGYREEESADCFRDRLEKARQSLKGLLDFERKILDETGLLPQKFQQSEDYLMFRAILSDRLDVLEEFGTYPHMIKPLIVEED